MNDPRAKSFLSRNKRWLVGFFISFFVILSLLIGWFVWDHHRSPLKSHYLLALISQYHTPRLSTELLDTRQISASVANDLMDNVILKKHQKMVLQLGLTSKQLQTLLSKGMESFLKEQFGLEEKQEDLRALKNSKSMVSTLLPILIGLPVAEVNHNQLMTNFSAAKIGHCKIVEQNAACSVVFKNPKGDSTSTQPKELVTLWVHTENVFVPWKLVGLYGVGELVNNL